MFGFPELKFKETLKLNTNVEREDEVGREFPGNTKLKIITLVVDSVEEDELKREESSVVEMGDNDNDLRLIEGLLIDQTATPLVNMEDE